MSLSNKHFERMAKAFRNNRPPDLEGLKYIEAWECWNALISEFCLMAEEENPRFDRIKFGKACGED